MPPDTAVTLRQTLKHVFSSSLTIDKNKLDHFYTASFFRFVSYLLVEPEAVFLVVCDPSMNEL
jgi:hypothetical protein